jgi:hypothetical protein
MSNRWSGIPNRSSVGKRTDILAVVDLRGATSEGPALGVGDLSMRAGSCERTALLGPASPLLPRDRDDDQLSPMRLRNPFPFPFPVSPAIWKKE